jgi:hypothetical protein
MNTKINLDFECFKTKNHVFKSVNNMQIGTFKINDKDLEDLYVIKRRIKLFGSHKCNKVSP